MFRFDLRPDWTSVLNDETPKRFRGIAYSGEVVPKFEKFGPVAIDLADFSDTSVPFLVDHDEKLNSVAGLGHVWRNENSQLEFEGELVDDTEGSNLVTKLFKSKYPLQMSVGFEAEPEISPRRKAQVVNGRQMTVRTIFRKPVLREVSFVAVGADHHTSVAAFAASESEMNDELQTKLDEITAERDGLLKEVESLKGELMSVQASMRQAELEQLGLTIGRAFSDEEKTVYMAMSADTFGVVKDSLVKITKELKPVKEEKPQQFSGRTFTDDLHKAAVASQPEQLTLSSIYDMAAKRRTM